VCCHSYCSSITEITSDSVPLRVIVGAMVAVIAVMIIILIVLTLIPPKQYNGKIPATHSAAQSSPIQSNFSNNLIMKYHMTPIPEAQSSSSLAESSYEGSCKW